METTATLFMRYFAGMMELKGNPDGSETGGVLQLLQSEEKAPL
jgi:hypothetical protein